jgi:hypothetical protein
MQKPDDEFLARCLMCNVLQYIDPTWLTLPVLQALIQRIISAFSMDFINFFHLIYNFSQEVRDSLPEPILRELCKHDCSIIKKFPKGPYDLFLNYASRGNHVDYDDVPVQYRTEDLFLAVFTHDPDNSSLPREAFTDNIVDKAIEKDPGCINFIPAEFLTHDRLTNAFNKKPELSLFNLHEIPEICWDQTLADLATATGDNINCIPDKYITRDMCIRAINFGSDISSIPKRLRDTDVYIEYLTQSYRPVTLGRYLPISIYKPSLLLKLAKKDAQVKNGWGIKNYMTVAQVPSHLWVKVLKICPDALKHIPKKDQTPAIIKTFFERAPIELIDELNWCINLGRITKDLVPLLVGTKVKVFQDIITRKMAPKPKSQHRENKEPEKVPKATLETVIVNLSNSEYLNFTERMLGHLMTEPNLWSLDCLHLV